MGFAAGGVLAGLAVVQVAPLVKQVGAKARALDRLQELLGDDRVGVDVFTVHGGDEALVNDKLVHQARLLERQQMAGHRGRCGHGGADEVGAATGTLTAFEIRLLVEAQRSPGSRRSAFIARHIEQPARATRKPAALEYLVQAFGFSLCLDEAGAGHDQRQLHVLGDAATHALDHRSGLAHVLDAAVGAGADEDLVDVDVADRLVGLQGHIGQRARWRRA